MFTVLIYATMTPSACSNLCSQSCSVQLHRQTPNVADKQVRAVLSQSVATDICGRWVRRDALPSTIAQSEQAPFPSVADWSEQAPSPPLWSGPVQTHCAHALFSPRCHPRAPRLTARSRVSRMHELVTGIRALKLLAWEEPLVASLTDVRRKELALLRRTLYIKAINFVLLNICPLLVALASFALFVALGQWWWWRWRFRVRASLASRPSQMPREAKTTGMRPCDGIPVQPVLV